MTKQTQFQVQLEKSHDSQPVQWFLFYADDFELALDHLEHCKSDPEFIANTGTPIINTCRASGKESLMKLEEVQSEPTTVDIKPTWQFAMKVYIMALENGTEEGRRAARDDLMALAKWVDELPSQGRSDAPEESFVLAHPDDPDCCWDGRFWSNAEDRGDREWLTFKSAKEAETYRRVHLHAVKAEVAVAMTNATVQINPSEVTS